MARDSLKKVRADLTPRLDALEALAKRLLDKTEALEDRADALEAAVDEISEIEEPEDPPAEEPDEEEPEDEDPPVEDDEEDDTPPEDEDEEEDNDPPAPPPTVPPQPTSGVLFAETFRAAIDRWHPTTNPKGRWKDNYWFGSDGDITHPGSGYPDGLWPDSASSRAGGHDMQTYSAGHYNGIEPFATGPNGLVIRAGVNPKRDAKTPHAYFGGLLTTQKSFSFRYGYLETRAKVSKARGAWPAVWLLGQPYSDFSGDEVDVLEHIAGEASNMYGFVHVPRLGRDLLDSKVSFNPDQWVTRGFLWTPDKLAFFQDGVEVASAANPANGLHQPMYILADLAVGPSSGGWGAVNQPGPNFAAEFAVDYIRVKAL